MEEKGKSPAASNDKHKVDEVPEPVPFFLYHKIFISLMSVSEHFKGLYTTGEIDMSDLETRDQKLFFLEKSLEALDNLPPADEHDVNAGLASLDEGLKTMLSSRKVVQAMGELDLGIPPNTGPKAISRDSVNVDVGASKEPSPSACCPDKIMDTTKKKGFFAKLFPKLDKGIPLGSKSFEENAKPWLLALAEEAGMEPEETESFIKRFDPAIYLKKAKVKGSSGRLSRRFSFRQSRKILPIR